MYGISQVMSATETIALEAVNLRLLASTKTEISGNSKTIAIWPYCKLSAVLAPSTSSSMAKKSLWCKTKGVSALSEDMMQDKRAGHVAIAIRFQTVVSRLTVIPKIIFFGSGCDLLLSSWSLIFVSVARVSRSSIDSKGSLSSYSLSFLADKIA